ncbi:MAG: PQQ-binding-like beta-propeller repeat protein, partial [bacterium]
MFRIAPFNLSIPIAFVVLFCGGWYGPAVAADEHVLAKRILEDAGVKGGLIVHLGCGDGKLTAALRVNDSFFVHGLDADAANVEQARAHIQSLGIYGPVSAEQWTNDYLPYTDNLVNLLVSEDLGAIPMDEVMRVLAPLGVAYIKREGKWTKSVKPWPEEIDEWTHYLHDASGNAVAKDTRVGPPQDLQWVAKPLYGRSHEIDSSVPALVSAEGRIFYILDEGLTGITDERLPPQWALIARDAFNGLLLWKRPLPNWGWREWKMEELEGQDWTGLRGQRTHMPIVLPRRLVADDDRVYVTLGFHAPLSVLDAASGRIIHTFDNAEGTDEILYSQGTLVVSIRKSDEVASRRSGESISGLIAAMNPDTGEFLWEFPTQGILPLSLAVGSGRAFFHNYKEIVCLDLTTGDELWRKPSEIGKSRLWGGGAPTTLVVYDKAVLFAGPDKFEAFSAETGEILWTGPGAQGPGASNPTDLFVIDGVVWYGGPDRLYRTDTWLKDPQVKTLTHIAGRDPLTGEIEQEVEIHNMLTPGHHFRCYRSKATERYLLWTKRGVEFIDLKSDNHRRHDWLRASCKLGFMPCNGLLYMPSHQCFCYPGAKLTGFNALAEKVESGKRETDNRFVRGPAYGNVRDESTDSDSDNWPTYRRTPERCGSISSTVPANVKPLWESEVGGKITQPVVADGRLFVASVDEHTVHALDAQNGEPIWSFTTSGRIDSPPTIYKGLVVFGSADGWVYCVRFSDGELVWRYRAAPEERRVVAFDQLESAWPVHGSVLVKNGVAYFSAGRSSYLDGGIFFYGVDPISGKKIHEGRLDGPHYDPEKDISRPFDMEGTTSDVLVTDGSYLYMKQAVLDLQLKEHEAPRMSLMGNR